MVISTIEESEIPEYNSLFTLVVIPAAAAGVVQVSLAAPGHHPKCRLVRATVLSLIYSTTPDQYLIEDGDGNDASVVAVQSATIGTPTNSAPIAGQVFERNEAIMAKKTVEGNAANVCSVTALFESIH